MKPVHIIVSLLLITLFVSGWMFARSPSRMGSVNPGIQNHHSPEKPSLSIKPLSQEKGSDKVEPLMTAKDAPPPSLPLQSEEERDDAMLFEIDALQGMPFDQSIIMTLDESFF